MLEVRKERKKENSLFNYSRFSLFTYEKKELYNYRLYHYFFLVVLVLREKFKK